MFSYGIENLKETQDCMFRWVDCSRASGPHNRMLYHQVLGASCRLEPQA